MGQLSRDKSMKFAPTARRGKGHQKKSLIGKPFHGSQPERLKRRSLKDL
jgi:hypothetical protein